PRDAEGVRALVRAPQQLGSVGESGEGVAELVPQGRHELVATARFLLEPPPVLVTLADVVHDDDQLPFAQRLASARPPLTSPPLTSPPAVTSRPIAGQPATGHLVANESSTNESITGAVLLPIP